MTAFAIIIILAIFFLITFAAVRTIGRDSQQKPRSRRTFPPSADDKGKRGERIVSNVLQSCAAENDRILNNIILFNKRTGGSSQIDHIFISSSGIYVIETKNYSGYIYGEEHQKEWTQVLNRRTKNKFHSPIKQNATHIWLVNQILHHAYPVYGYVVFVQGNTEHILSDLAVTPRELAYCLKNKHGGALSPREIETAYCLLSAYRDSNCVSEEQHLQDIQKMKNDIADNICPRCGKALILREGKYGKFYGCENYPKCKFTKKINP